MKNTPLSIGRDNHPGQETQYQDDRMSVAASASGGLAEMQPFHHNALRVLGDNYLIRAWLPKKGPAFVALIQAMRCHIYYDFVNGEQKTHYFPEAATLAKLAGISRALVFRLLNDPDMALFIKRINRRRYSPEHQREVQTSNLYMVAMDDPPTPEDRHKVEEAQRRIDAINRGEDPDAPARSARSGTGKSSESQIDTLRGVSNRDSHSSINLRHEDRMTINNIQGDIRRSVTSDERARTIGNEAAANWDDHPDRAQAPHVATKPGTQRTTKIGSTSESELSIRGEMFLSKTRVSVDDGQQNRDREDNGIPAPAILSESAMYKADARACLDTTRLPVTRKTVLEHQLDRYGVTEQQAAVERILSAHAQTRTPVELLVELSEIARKQVDRYATQRDENDIPMVTNPGGYYITTLCNLAKKAQSVGFDLQRIRLTPAKNARKDQAKARLDSGLTATPPPASRAQGRSRGAQSGADAAGRSKAIWGNDDLESRLKDSLYGR